MVQYKIQTISDAAQVLDEMRSSGRVLSHDVRSNTYQLLARRRRQQAIRIPKGTAESLIRQGLLSLTGTRLTPRKCLFYYLNSEGIRRAQPRGEKKVKSG